MMLSAGVGWIKRRSPVPSAGDPDPTINSTHDDRTGSEPSSPIRHTQFKGRGHTDKFILTFISSTVKLGGHLPSRTEGDASGLLVGAHLGTQIQNPPPGRRISSFLKNTLAFGCPLHLCNFDCIKLSPQCLRRYSAPLGYSRKSLPRKVLDHDKSTLTTQATT